MTGLFKNRETYECCSRFRVAIRILQLSGLGVNEIKFLTRADFQTLKQGDFLKIKQTKTRAIREISFGTEAIK